MLLVPLRALAQEEAPPPPPQRTPPVLTEFIAAPAPAGLEDRSAAVVLEITVEVDGTVSDVQVAEAAGEGFDEAALEAARRFVFEPARRDGVAVRARIRYRYLFEPVVVTTTVTEEVPDETLEEETSEEEEGGSEEASLEETEGSEETERDPEEEGEGEGEGDETELGVEAVVYAPPRDGLRRTLEREVLTTIPGTRGDALRVVELLPGVGRPAFGGGVVLVRGAAPGDSEVYLDGVPVPLLYHFGGLTSFYNSQLLDRIDFVPGNFSVRYGRRIGGILEVTPRDPRTDEYHGFVDINLIDASLMIEGPIGEHFAFAVAARRSWIDLILGEVLPANGPNFLAAPVYYDYQLMLTYRPDASHRFRLIVYGSSDQLALLFNGPGGNDPNVRGNFGISTQFHRAQLSWLLLHEDWFEQEITVAFGGTLLDIAIGESTRLDADFLPLQIRSEWRAQIAETSRIVGGLDIQITPLTLSFLGGQPTQSEGMPAMPGGSRVAFDSGNVTAYRPGAYIESQNTLFDRLDMVVGVRADWYREIQSWSIDPRLTTRLRVIPEVSVRAAVGLFSQPPEFQNTTPGIGNPELAPTRAIHVGLGADLELEEYRLRLSLDGFYKHIQDRVVGTSGGQPPFFTNDGLGRIYGLEVGARVNPGGPSPVFGFLSYTLMRSERQDGPDQPWRLFDFDQTHILSLALVWNIGDGWQAGATFRLVSGNPYTPVVGAVNDLSAGIYRPLYGPTNSDRNPFFHRLDARIEKRFDIGDFGYLTIYIDVQNVYNATNREGVTYSYDYSESNDIPGLPIIPSLGIRGEL
jgi:TonB family protein